MLESFREMRRPVQQAEAETGRYLIHRWGKSITKRRRCFAYWQSHAAKLARGRDFQTSQLDLPPTTRIVPLMTAGASFATEPSLVGNTEDTEATAYEQNLDKPLDAPSTTSDDSTDQGMENTTLGFLLPPPTIPPGQSEFTCPYCCIVCPSHHAKGRHWRDHIARDLQPYMCTYSDCLQADTMYTSRGAWMDHEEETHRKAWHCFQHTDSFKTKGELRHHLETSHQTLGPAQISAMTDHGFGTPDHRTTCPFCLSKGPFGKDGMSNHMASHMEVLALFAVPRGTRREVDDSSDKSNSGNAQGGGSSSSLRSVVLDYSRGEAMSLTGHTGYVRSIAFSPDGTRLASASDDTSIKVWNTATSECLDILEGHNGWVISVAFSADGKRLASGSSDSSIRIWDVETGKRIRTLVGHGGSVLSVAFSADGTRLASSSEDTFIKIWNPETGTCGRTLKGHGHFVQSIALSADTRQLISGSDDTTIKIWNPTLNKCIRTLRGHGGYVWKVALSPDGKRIASGSSDKTVKIWDVATGECLHTLMDHGVPVRSVAFSPDGNQLASGSEDEMICIWDVASGECIRTLTGHRGGVLSMVYASDGRLASSSLDRTIRIWNL